MYPDYDTPTRQLHKDEVQNLKEPIFFYYSRCYYQHNSHRMHERWQVARGNVSWDIGIEDMKYIGHIKLDLAIPYFKAEDGA